MTPIAMFAAGIVSARSFRLRRLDRPAWVVTFHGIFALGMFLVGMEGISWGQQIFHWETPPLFDWIRQGETNFHNNPFLKGKTELLRLTFGLSGTSPLPSQTTNAWCRVTLASGGRIGGPRNNAVATPSLSIMVTATPHLGSLHGRDSGAAWTERSRFQIGLRLRPWLCARRRAKLLLWSPP